MLFPLYNNAMAKYPVFLELSGKCAVVIGGGAVAVRKARKLVESGAELTVIAEHTNDELIELAQSTQTKLIKSKYSKDYLSGATLVIAATNDHELNKQIYKDCQQLGLLCNVVDVPELCDFFVPAVVKRGDLQIAVSTEGQCPAYARYLRKKLEQIFTDKHGEFLAELKVIRKHIVKNVPNHAERKALLEQLVGDKSFECFIQDGSTQWQEYADSIIKADCSK